MDPDETTEESTSTDAADEIATSDSPADDAPSSAASAPEETEEPAEETPEETAAREKKARNDARIKAADAAEAKAEAARATRRKQREAQEQEERIVAREREANETLRRAKSLIDELEQRKQQALRGGFEGLKALGIEYGDWTKKTLEQTSPDALAQQALERAERLEAEIKRRDDAAAADRSRSEQEESVKRFEAFVETNAEDFPHAAELPSRLFRVLADEAAVEYIERYRVAPTYSALLPLLDRKAKAIHEEQQKKSAKRVRPVTTPSDGAPNTQATTNGHPASTPANRTLSPATAATKATAKRAPTPEEEDEWCLAELRQAMKSDKASNG